MTDFLASLRSQSEDFILNILASGPIPRHVAFVMDGNRRYARQHNQEIREGHTAGFAALRRVRQVLQNLCGSKLMGIQMLEVCMKLNIQCVSAYAFSIENFKRSQEEVDALMDLAETKLLELCQHGCVMCS